MDFNLNKKDYKERNFYNIEEKEISKKFSENLIKEVGNLCFSTILFGSSVKEKKNKDKKIINDIDLLVILNDTSNIIEEELTNAYQIIVKKIIAKTDERLHVTTLRLTRFWQLLQQGDAVIINIVREGLPIYDRGFFLPIKSMLLSGLIKPSLESIYVYHQRSKQTLFDAKIHLLRAVNDLYWSVVDSAHSLLMYYNYIPPSPEHVCSYLREYKETIKLEEEYIKIVELFYHLYKKIEHKNISSITGEDYDNLHTFAEKFVNKINSIIDPDE